jgi:hypothetical protein
MLLRERRLYASTQVYQARLVSAGLNIPQAVFEAWTMLFVDEVTHDNYQPSVVKQKRRILDSFDKQRRTETARVDRVEQYTVASQKDLAPYSLAELEKIRGKLRRRALERAQGQK